jgi:hypothetical protein
MDLLTIFLATKASRELWYGESIECVSFDGNKIIHDRKRCKYQFCDDLITHILITMNAIHSCRFKRSFKKPLEYIYICKDKYTS